MSYQTHAEVNCGRGVENDRVVSDGAGYSYSQWRPLE